MKKNIYMQKKIQPTSVKSSWNQIQWENGPWTMQNNAEEQQKHKTLEFYNFL